MEKENIFTHNLSPFIGKSVILADNSSSRRNRIMNKTRYRTVKSAERIMNGNISLYSIGKNS